MANKFFKQIDLQNRNEMINFLNNHPTSIIYSDFPNKWTFANNIGFVYNIPMQYHPVGFEAITDQPKHVIDNLINKFKFKHGFKYGAYRSDYNDNILLLVHRVEIGKDRCIKIQNFDSFKYETFSTYYLQERTKLLCAFDALCDKIVLEYYEMIAKYSKTPVM